MNTSEDLVLSGRVVAKSARRLQARIYGYDSSPILPDALDSVAVRVFDMTDGSETYSETFTPGDVVFAELGSWPTDAEGYNFETVLPGEAWPIGRREYRAEFRFEVAGGNTFYVLFELEAVAIYSE